MSTKTLEEVPRVRVSVPLRALLLEDSDHDVELMLAELKHAGFEVNPTVVTTKEDFREALAEESFDVVLADHRLPTWSGLEALAELRH